MRFGTVAIVGRTNVGKSTFLNACLGERLAIVSPQPQTTRDEILGVVHRPTSQIAFTDTPGLHRPKNELGRRMNARALDTLRSHDVTLFMTDSLAATRKAKLQGESDALHPDDRRLLSTLQPDVPCILVVNKVDLLADKSKLLPLMTAFGEARDFAALIPISATKGDGVERVLAEIERLLPQREPGFAEDMLTDRPLNFLAREFIREQVLLQTQSEVPHAVAVTIDRYEDGTRLCRISATIHVEKAGQRAILIGRRGEMIKSLGTQARLEIEKWVQKQVHLELFVRISDRWKDVPRQLNEMGYDGNRGSRSLENVLPEIPGGGADTRPRKVKPRVDGKAPPRGAQSTRPARPRPAAASEANVTAAAQTGSASPAASGKAAATGAAYKPAAGKGGPGKSSAGRGTSAKASTGKGGPSKGSTGLTSKKNMASKKTSKAARGKRPKVER